MSPQPLLAPSPAFRLSPANPKDYPEIVNLNLKAYGDLEEDLSARAWQRLVNNLSDVAFQARSNSFWVMRNAQQAIIGSIAYAPPGSSDPDFIPPDWAAFISLAVDPDWQRQGIASQLVQTCMELAQQDEAPAIGLFTSDLMLPALRLYRSLGFTRQADLGVVNTMRYWRYGKVLAAI